MKDYCFKHTLPHPYSCNIYMIHDIVNTYICSAGPSVTGDICLGGCCLAGAWCLGLVVMTFAALWS